MIRTYYSEDEFWIPLQWFAAEDEGRTEDPTEQKIRKAREEGKVAKTPDLTSSVVLLLPIVLIASASGFFFSTMQEMVGFYLSNAVTQALRGPLFEPEVFFNYFLKLALPVLIVALVAAVLGNVIQVGFMFTTKAIMPDFTKIVPKIGKFIQKTLFSAEAFFNLAKSILKVIVIAVIAWINITGEWPKFAHLADLPLPKGMELVGWTSMNIIIQSAFALLLMSIPDFMFQQWRHKESLMMSKEEIKEERKQSEGDPLVKGRLREKMRQILRQNLEKTIPQATVIITNPTHFACALEWNEMIMAAPTLTAKGEDLMAQKIRELANENGVPLVENRPLARSLYYSVNIGDQIPEEYWELVVRILAEIQKVNSTQERSVV